MTEETKNQISNNLAMLNQYSTQQVIDQKSMINTLMTDAMQEGVHYGKIPGCGDKKSMFKAGAEEIGVLFRLAPEYQIKVTDLRNDHREYEILCTLRHITSGSTIGQGVGSGSTMESKFRFRKAGRVCPECGSEDTIIAGKVEYGGGWLCYVKKGGCGAKFQSGDKAIEDQKLGRVEYDNPADYYNTVLKMAKKRAHIDAILTATAASHLFEQDLEDMAENGVAPTEEQKKPSKAETMVKANQKSTSQTDAVKLDITDELNKILLCQSIAELNRVYDAAFETAKVAKDTLAMAELNKARNSRKREMEENVNG